MYPGAYVKKNPSKAAFIMASTGEEVSYQVFDERSNQLAHYLRYEGLKKNDHYSVFMENNNRYLESNSAGERAGLYCTCINSYLKTEELSYILINSSQCSLLSALSKTPIKSSIII